MNAADYQKLAMRTNDGNSTERLEDSIYDNDVKDIGGVINAALGLSGEVGELNDMIKKSIFHGHEIERSDVVKEIGDICWYVAMMCESTGISMEEVLDTNIEKLKRRYPDGFSEKASRERVE